MTKLDAWRALPTLTKREIGAGYCADGHELVPGVVRNLKGYVRCQGCYDQLEPGAVGLPTCRSGRHPKPARGKCPACIQERRARESSLVQAAQGKDLSYLFVGLPPAAVLDEAACGPDTAELFDPLEKKGRPADNVVGKMPARVLVAMEICAGCPVRAACLDDAIRWRREGVYGGAYFTRRWHWRAAAARREGAQMPPLRIYELERLDPVPESEAS